MSREKEAFSENSALEVDELSRYSSFNPYIVVSFFNREFLFQSSNLIEPMYDRRMSALNVARNIRLLLNEVKTEAAYCSTCS